MPKPKLPLPKPKPFVAPQPSTQMPWAGQRGTLEDLSSFGVSPEDFFGGGGRIMFTDTAAKPALQPKQGSMNTQQQAYINGFVKRAAEYGYSEEQALDILKQAEESLSPDKEEQYQRARMHPAAAVLTSGPLPTVAYGAYKDYQNREINPFAKEMAEIEPEKIWSSARMKHYKDHSASDILLNEQIKKMLLGGGLGGLTGAAIPALAKLTGAVEGLGGDDVGLGGLLGFSGGALGGAMYGSYAGSKKYNDVIKKRLAAQ